MPHESTLPIFPFISGCLAMFWKMPSAMVERQILPRQTNRTDMGSGMVETKRAVFFLQQGDFGERELKEVFGERAGEIDNGPDLIRLNGKFTPDGEVT